jgi:hypothetical protein
MESIEESSFDLGDRISIDLEGIGGDGYFFAKVLWGG